MSMYVKRGDLRGTLGRCLTLCAALCGALGSAQAQGGGSLWTSAGQNITNTRNQSAESKISVDSVGRLGVKWVFAAGGDVSATPAVDGSKVYVPDWAGNLYAVDRRTGKKVWSVTIGSITGVPFDKARATPAVAGGSVIIGTQGSILVPGGGPGGKVIALDKETGAVLWVTTVDAHPAAIVTQSATVHDGRVLIGVASMEEALAGFVPGYPCCSFRGSMLALDAGTGAILWKTSLAPPGYSGNAVWGSSPAVDVKRGQVYIATGNNYSLPPPVQACVAAAGSDADAVKACIAADNHFDSIVALDTATGAVRWATRALPFDAWTVSCFPLLGDGSNCPEPAGPDYDFGQAPALFRVTSATGQARELVGAGQKSGQYWALDPGTGAVKWVTQAGPGGTGGGLQWGSAVDGRRIYTANANSNVKPWTLPDGTSTSRGVWSALDAATGQVLWQRSPPNADVGGWGETSGPVTTANGVMFSCSVGPVGYMYALNGATGEVLWTFDGAGGSCLSGAAISHGEVFWGSGYSNFGFGVGNNKLYAFELK